MPPVPGLVNVTLYLAVVAVVTRATVGKLILAGTVAARIVITGEGYPSPWTFRPTYLNL